MQLHCRCSPIFTVALHPQVFFLTLLLVLQHFLYLQTCPFFAVFFFFQSLSVPSPLPLLFCFVVFPSPLPFLFLLRFPPRYPFPFVILVLLFVTTNERHTNVSVMMNCIASQDVLQLRQEPQPRSFHK